MYQYENIFINSILYMVLICPPRRLSSARERVFMDKRPARLSPAFDRSAGAPSPFPQPGGRWPADAPLHIPAWPKPNKPVTKGNKHD
jgi:hypothetical protein